MGLQRLINARFFIITKSGPVPLKTISARDMLDAFENSESPKAKSCNQKTKDVIISIVPPVLCSNGTKKALQIAI